MQTQVETWKCIKGFEGLYEISTLGNIKIIRKEFVRLVKPHLSGVKRRNYPQVTLYKDGNKYTKRVHSLMAITYLNHEYGNRKIVVDHIDNNPLNNKLSNLQIITMKENFNKDR